MKIKILSGMLSAMLICAAENAVAAPTLYPEDFIGAIRNQTNSDVLADDQSGRRFYVLPPSDAVAQVTGLHTVTANVGFCGELAKLQRYNSDTLDLLNAMKTKDLYTKNQLEQQNKKYTQANEELSNYVVAADLQELSSLDVRITQLERRLDELYVKYKNCSQDCPVLAQDIEDSQLLRIELLTKRFELSTANLMASTEYERKRANVAAIKNNLTEIEKNWKQIQADLKDVYIDFNRMFDAHALREGGRAAISFNSGWTENLRRLSEQNPNLSFEKVSTKNAVIRAGAYSKNNLIPGGSVLAFDVGGSSADGRLVLEAYPENFSGNVVLNLLAVCPLLHPDWFDIKVANKLENMTYGITVGYEYPAAMKYEITAHYNMRRMFEAIKSQGTSGGFFSSDSWSDQDEQEYFKDSFWVDWKIQDDKFLMTTEQKLAINSDLRRQVMSRMAAQLVMNNPGALGSLSFELPKTGAVVLANSLDKSCPLNVYCKGASIVLNVLQAVFGSSGTEQTLSQISNVEMTDTYSHSQIVMQPRLTTYR